MNAKVKVLEQSRTRLPDANPWNREYVRERVIFAAIYPKGHARREIESANFRHLARVNGFDIAAAIRVMKAAGLWA